MADLSEHGRQLERNEADSYLIDRCVGDGEVGGRSRQRNVRTIIAAELT